MDGSWKISRSYRTINNVNLGLTLSKWRDIIIELTRKRIELESSVEDYFITYIMLGIYR